MGSLLSATPGTTEAPARWTAGAQAELTVMGVLFKGMLPRGQEPGGLTGSGELHLPQSEPDLTCQDNLLSTW